MIYLNICKTLHNICEMEKKLQQLLHLHKKFVFFVTDLFKIISSKSVSVCEHETEHNGWVDDKLAIFYHRFNPSPGFLFF
jgi:hypothetical protein